MHYNFNLEIPANTSKSNKIEQICKINYGIIRQVVVYFRGGCADLAHVTIYHWERQIFPTNINQNYAFDDYPVVFESFYPILEVPYELKIYGWNLDDIFSHTITFMFNILHPKATEIPEMETMKEEEALALLGNYEFKEMI